MRMMIYLQMSATFLRITTFSYLNVHGVNDFMQMEMHAAEPLDPDSAFLG
jgi:hypothetical protein